MQAAGDSFRSVPGHQPWEPYLDVPTEAYPEMSWCGWGDPAQVPSLPERVRGLLADALGVREPAGRRASLEEIELPPARLPGVVSSELRGVVGQEHAREDREARIRHTRGRSTLDLLRMRAGDALDAPDLVVMPGSHQEVLALLAICSRRRVAVVPFGGGTSVVGGLQARSQGYAGLVSLDLRRMSKLLELDEQSRLAVLEPGLRGPQAEALLGRRGYTLGHFPQSYEFATLGGFAATRSSGQASAGYGRFDELVLALRVATPVGELTVGRAPKSAAGPDLRQLFLGSEGALGVITALTLQLRPAPAARVYDGWRLPSFAEGLAALRHLSQDVALASVLRLSDEAETAVNLSRPDDPGAGPGGGGCLAIVGYEGAAEHVTARRELVSSTLARAGAEPVPEAGEQWARDRFRGPYLRDALLDAGALVETLETVAFWSSIPPLYDAVIGALRESLSALGTPPLVLCHVSHVYPSGASLYFTVACAQLDDAQGQWRAAKAAASDAILAAGGSITHHHGVGGDHRDWYRREIGELSVQTLSAVKATVDPEGVLSPGILIT